MSDLYTAAQEAEQTARDTIAGSGHCRPGGCEEPDCQQAWTRVVDACLAAAAACEAVATAVRQVQYAANSTGIAYLAPIEATRVLGAMESDYAARAVAWRKVAGGEKP